MTLRMGGDAFYDLLDPCPGPDDQLDLGGDGALGVYCYCLVSKGGSLRVRRCGEAALPDSTDAITDSIANDLEPNQQ